MPVQSTTEKTAAVERGRSLSLWRQVLAELEREILAGQLTPGERLPTEAALAARFNVHRHTIRHAIEALRDKHLLRVEHGHGIFVRERTVPHALGPQSRLSATLRHLSRVSDRKLLATKRSKADADVAAALSIRTGTFVRRVDLLTEIEGTPISYAEMYFPLPRLTGIEKHIAATGSITKSLLALGVPKYRRRETRIGARLPTAAEADLLGMLRAQPVITIWSVDIDESDVPVAFSRSCSPARWLELVVRF